MKIRYLSFIVAIVVCMFNVSYGEKYSSPCRSFDPNPNCYKKSRPSKSPEKQMPSVPSKDSKAPVCPIKPPPLLLIPIAAGAVACNEYGMTPCYFEKDSYKKLDSQSREFNKRCIIVHEISHLKDKSRHQCVDGFLEGKTKKAGLESELIAYIAQYSCITEASKDCSSWICTEEMEGSRINTYERIKAYMKELEMN